MKNTFIISTGRTGTKALAKYFDSYKDVRGAHEAIPTFRNKGIHKMYGKKISFGKRMSLKISRFFQDSYFLRKKYLIYNPQKIKFPFVFFSSISCKNALINAVSRFFLRIFKSPRHYVEANNFFFSMIPELRKNFKNVKIILVVRNGKDFVRSALNRGNFSDNDIKERLRGDLCKDVSKDKWAGWTALQKCTWLWVFKNNFVEKQNPDLVVKFEDIFLDKERKGLRKICEEIGIPYDEKLADKIFSERINKAGSTFVPKYKEWSDHWKKDFEEVAGKTMEHYDYQ